MGEIKVASIWYDRYIILTVIRCLVQIREIYHDPFNLIFSDALRARSKVVHTHQEVVLCGEARGREMKMMIWVWRLDNGVDVVGQNCGGDGWGTGRCALNCRFGWCLPRSLKCYLYIFFRYDLNHCFEYYLNRVLKIIWIMFLIGIKSCLNSIYIMF